MALTLAASTSPSLSIHPAQVYLATEEIAGEQWDSFSFTLRIPLHKDYSAPGKITVNLYDAEGASIAINRLIWTAPQGLATQSSGFVTVSYHERLRSSLNISSVEVWILPGDPRPQAQANISVLLQRYQQQGTYSLPFNGWWSVLDKDAVPSPSGITNPAEQYSWHFVKRGIDGLACEEAWNNIFNHKSYNQAVLAVADGKVVRVHKGCLDNKFDGLTKPQRMGDLWGNYVIISHNNGEYSYYSNLALASIKVRQGQRVHRWQIIGACGNSGDSNTPHLGFGFIDKAKPFRKPNAALVTFDPAFITASSLPITFADVVVNELGNRTLDTANPLPSWTVANLTPEIISQIEEEE